ncbi:peptide ABC transporter substrate-binding protein SapA [Photobacterium sp. WH77]|uniref:ABC transporter substrate-binding protein SapA n=1 Tax=unclassified Photobacterium TaxID=2628852 RepID=UPI001EDC2107|nr:MULTISPECIES: ABC transporter substrate-binding protein SapA [unclassified Photobacterium]MCG2838580.1 peptide ABC transporter substrate-binding protein SapA [Photobacterium sp. WH77]MCG2846199.1 peptide ABC transporter substrate-binding protein SapA [Photobacterium sp. WH80]
MNACFRLLLTCAGLLGLTACSQPQHDNTIRQWGFIYCGQDTPWTFNPQLTDGGHTADSLAAQVFDRLLQLDPISHLPQPALASSWSVSEDGLEYTFTLRKDVRFQQTANFAPTRHFNAEDVVFSFKRVIDPKHPYHSVSGGHYPWFESQSFGQLIDSIDSLDTSTVRFTLTRPDNAFLSTLSSSYAAIHSAEYADQLLREGHPDYIDTKPVGTGPFYLAEYHPHDLIRLKRNAFYWRGAPFMNQVVFDISSRGTGSLAKLLNHECDVLSSPVASQLPVIKNNPDFELIAQTAMNVAFLAINNNIPALQDVRVRQALNLAINRENLLDSVYYGTGTKAKTLLPPMSWAHDAHLTDVNYDPDTAMALLKEAGYSNNLHLILAVPMEPRPYNPSPRKTAELIQADLRAVGVDVTLLLQDRPLRPGSVAQKGIDLTLTGWVADNGDPDNFLRPLLSCSAKQAGLNVANWCNLQFDNLLELASRTTKLDQRMDYYQYAQGILRDEVPIIPLAHGIHYQIHHKSLHGLHLSPFGTRSFSNVYRSE